MKETTKEKEAIQKAKSAGYFWDSGCEFACVESHFLNPEFWKYLGKALGWPKNHLQDRNALTWLDQWHRFIDCLAEGNSVKRFFTNLL